MREGIGANAFGAPDQAITTMFFVEDPSASTSAEDDSLDAVASAGKILQSLRVTVLSADQSIDSALRSSDSDEETSASEEQSAGEREAMAALFGRYIGQIEARVERAWLRPRAPIGADTFDCRVQVLQSQRGEVQEVTLERCNGSAQWQLSLVRAIESASPLPAPPDPHAFAESLLLSFESRAYAGASREEGFEPTAFAVPPNAADLSPSQPAETPQ